MADLSPGVASAISPLVRRIVGPNGGPLTGPGTNTYLVGVDEIVVVDPGPDEAAHVDAIVGCGGDRIRWIALTHSHHDHAAAAATLAARTGAELLAFPAVGEGFELEATEFRLLAMHTPGHSSDHLCFLLEEERMLFTGDTLVDGSTVMIAPPDGDMAAYLASLERLASRRLRLRSIAPGHGALVDDPAARLAAYLSHRLDREAEILAALEGGAVSVDQLVARIYVDTDAALLPAAAQTVHAHLLKLAAEGRATGDDGAWHGRAA
ncbi:MAG: MBL fold metallo-hydrolase [Actinomycetota bacterium]|nr:MBL fold metallo-hydrolase [Actinomycetota bacterium]